MASGQKLGTPSSTHSGGEHRRRQKAARDKWWSMASTFFFAVSGPPGTPSECQLHLSGCSKTIWFQRKEFFYQHVNSTKPKGTLFSGGTRHATYPHSPVGLFGSSLFPGLIFSGIYHWRHSLNGSCLSGEMTQGKEGCSPCSQQCWDFSLHFQESWLSSIPWRKPLAQRAIPVASTLCQRGTQ